MHERTQRAIARLMFVFCCAVPTGLTMFCILVSWTPWYHHRSLRAIEAGLSRDTGLVVEIEDFKRAAPSTLHLYDVRALDPETRLEVARVRELQWVSSGDEVSIFLHQPELQSRELSSLWRLIHDRFLCRPEQTVLPVQVAGNDLTIHSRTGAVTLRDVNAWIQPRDDSVEATIQCIPATSRSNAPINIAIRRDRSGQQPATRFTLDTNGTPLPCSALAEYFPQLESLGSEAMFFGRMEWQLESDQWWIDLGSSWFEQVSLDKLFEKQIHRLSGTATLKLRRCRIEPHNRKSDIVGSVHAEDGLVGRSLLMSVHQHLGFGVEIPDGMIDPTGDVPYDRIAIDFKIHNSQLDLHGICRREIINERNPAGVVLCLDGLPLVRSSNKTLQALSVITAIAPSHSVPVPISNQTSWLTNVLIPPSRPLPREDGYLPRVRFSENSSDGPTVSQPRIE
jgi:hypothetical protein